MKVNFVVRRTKKKVDGTVPIEIYIKKMNTENGLFPPDCIIVGGLCKGHAGYHSFILLKYRTIHGFIWRQSQSRLRLVDSFRGNLSKFYLDWLIIPVFYLYLQAHKYQKTNVLPIFWYYG